MPNRNREIEPKGNTEFLKKLRGRGEAALKDSGASPARVEEFKEQMEAFEVSAASNTLVDLQVPGVLALDIAERCVRTSGKRPEMPIVAVVLLATRTRVFSSRFLGSVTKFS